MNKPKPGSRRCGLGKGFPRRARKESHKHRKDVIALRINTNISAINAHRQHGIAVNNLSRNVERLSSGFRINRAGDDPAGLAISERMRAQIRGLGMASRNSQDAISLVQTAEGGMQTIHDILQRIREIAVQSANGTNQDIDRGALHTEARQLVDEINDVASSTQFNQMNLLDGQVATLQFQTGANQNQTMTITLPNVSNTTLGGNNGNSVSTINLSTQQGATEALEIIDRAIGQVSMDRANLGAIQSRLEFRVQNLDNQAVNIADAESRIRDVDMAHEMTRFTRNNILLQASTAMLAQANAIPQSVMQLLVSGE